MGCTVYRLGEQLVADVSRDGELGRRRLLPPRFSDLRDAARPTLKEMTEGDRASGATWPPLIGKPGQRTDLVPARFRGAWRRSALWIDGKEVEDPLEVWWLQTPSVFADIRFCQRTARLDEQGPSVGGLLTAETAFAGVAEWDGALMTWHHALDAGRAPTAPEGQATGADVQDPPVLVAACAADVGELDSSGEQLLERGSLESADGLRTYQEAWSLKATLGEDWSADCTPERIAVSIGSFQVVVEDRRPEGPFLAELRRRIGRGWRLDGRLSLA